MPLGVTNVPLAGTDTTSVIIEFVAGEGSTQLPTLDAQRDARPSCVDCRLMSDHEL
jgi:hypothetical protein